jgi:hypothetical protein
MLATVLIPRLLPYERFQKIKLAYLEIDEVTTDILL